MSKRIKIVKKNDVVNLFRKVMPDIGYTTEEELNQMSELLTGKRDIEFMKMFVLNKVFEHCISEIYHKYFKKNDVL